MADPDVLTHAFLVAHPSDAARVLERLAPAEAAALFERIPARLGAPVLAAMLPHAAARCLATLEPERGALLLGAMSPPLAAASLRPVAEPTRARLLAALPTAVALACRALLGYPDDSVGAWADTDVVALPAESTAGEALDAVRGAAQTPRAPVFVVGADQRLLGTADMSVLLRASADVRLEALLRATPSLSAVTPLAGAAALSAWHETDVIAVVERGGRLVGALYRHTLEEAMRGRASAPDPTVGSLPALLARGYWAAASGLAEATLALLIRARGGGS